jgi:hypothetical protein
VLCTKITQRCKNKVYKKRSSAKQEGEGGDEAGGGGGENEGAENEEGGGSGVGASGPEVPPNTAVFNLEL